MATTSWDTNCGWMAAERAIACISLRVVMAAHKLRWMLRRPGGGCLIYPRQHRKAVADIAIARASTTPGGAAFASFGRPELVARFFVFSPHGSIAVARPGPLHTRLNATGSAVPWTWQSGHAHPAARLHLIVSRCCWLWSGSTAGQGAGTYNQDDTGCRCRVGSGSGLDTQRVFVELSGAALVRKAFAGQHFT